MIIRSAYPDVAVPEVALPELLLGDLGTEDAGRLAVIDAASGAGYTFGELAHAVDRVAAALAERGIGRGDVVALFAPNSPDYPVVFHGGLAAGAAVSPVNALYTAHELGHQLRDAAATILFCGPDGLERAMAAVATDGVRVREIVVLGPAAPGATPFTELLASTAASPQVRIDPSDVAALPYSSGTTGLPKGVLLTHRNLVANLLQMDPLGRVEAGSRLIAVLPLFHIYGLTGIMNQGLHRRATVITMPRFDLAGFLSAVATHRIDHLYIAPPIALALATHPLVADYDLSCVDVVMSAAAPLSTELADAVATRLDATVVQGYGLTESSPCTHGIPVDRPDIDRGSIGVPMPGVEARIVDPATGEDAARGELWCRGPNIMRGYLNNPAATAAAIDADGFLHTGDIVTIDDAGAFHVVDRLKELIKYKGYQVAPAELEALLLTHPGIADAAVIGVPAVGGEEVPKAFVVLATTRDAGHDLEAAEVMAFVAERVAPYKKVREVEFLDRIPKSAAGKILRKELRNRAAAPA
ncbi:AMP-binding protein [Pseudonocardia sp. GCM10023141]|uniref:AMP-binding protein n=1 Tax=Pseudonocardia sp. GCM10023141 TaxID=3252653 RepID=UPI00361C71FF